jgi:ATP-dependent DNA helicase PIF1
MAAHNVDGMTAHSAFHLSAGKGTKFSSLKPDIKNTMRSHLYRLKVLIIDEISMLSSIHLDQISLRLGEIFETPPGVHFGGISVLAVGDFFQLPPIAAPPAFKSKGGQGTAALVDNPQWALFKIFR